VEFAHIPVMTEKVMEFADVKPGKTFVDATLGGGGHSRAILEAMKGKGLLVALDRDPDAVAHGREIFQAFENIRIVRANYSQLPAVLDNLGIEAVDGIVADLGLSLHQLAASGRGFSFQADEPLGMRMDGPDGGPTAGDIVNTASAHELLKIFRDYGQEQYARRIVDAILRERQKAPLATSFQLGQVVAGAVPAAARKKGIHPATRVFQALRIKVNEELVHLERFLECFPACLKSGGRICIISFHSLEDSMVKAAFRSLEKTCTCPVHLPCVCGRKPRAKVITRRAVKPSDEEVSRNPSSRSARMRVLEML
jgi:16S rRNA (cytosine1402-N4)-methyltransferase